jgi:CheY-like chemotaxis protein
MAGKRILFIDGDQPFVHEVAAAAEEHGYETLVSTSSTEGVEIARTERPDLVVVSVELSPTNGWSVCTRLKKDDELKDIPVILTSASSTPDTFEKHRKLRTRADEYLLKPYVPDDLIRLAGGLLGVPEAVSEEDLLVEGDESLVGAEYESASSHMEIQVPADEPLANGHSHGADPLGGLDEALPALASEGGESAGSLDYDAPVEDVVSYHGADSYAAVHEGLSESELAMEDSVNPDDLVEESAEGGTDEGTDVSLDPSVPALHLSSADSMSAEGHGGYETTSEEEAVLAAIDGQATQDRIRHSEGSHLNGLAANGHGLDTGHEIDSDPLAHAASLPGLHEYAADPPSQPPPAPEYREPPPQVIHDDSGRVAELEARVATLEAEIEGFRATEGSHDQELERLRLESSQKSQEAQILRDQLYEKERVIREMKEAESRVAMEAAKTRDERTRRDAAIKALTQKAEQMSAQTNRLEREMATVKEEANAAVALRARVAELEQLIAQARQAAEAELADAKAKHQQVSSRVQELENTLARAQEASNAEVAALKQQVEQGRRDLDRVRAAHGQAVIDLESARSDYEAARGQLDETRRLAELHSTTATSLQEKLTAAEEQVQSLSTQTQASTELARRTRAQLLKLAEELGLTP